MYFIGLDLGQRRDFSAVAVVERAEGLHVRHLERLALGTPYRDVVARVSDIAWHPQLRGKVRVVVDATGVGAPVVEMMRAGRVSCRVTAVTITGGEREHGRGEDWHVPKKDLLSGVRVLLEEGQLKIHRELDEAATLVRELTEIRVRQAAGGSVRMGFRKSCGGWARTRRCTPGRERSAECPTRCRREGCPGRRGEPAGRSNREGSRRRSGCRRYQGEGR